MVQNYVMAKEAGEALRLLAGYEGRGRIIAGGTDLVLDLQSGKYQADCLVDITGIPGLAETKLCEGVLEVGAAVTHNHAAESPLIRQYAYALAKASHSVGSNQIRNCSTIGGNIVNGQPAADSAVALAALGASVEVMSEYGTELLSMDRLYAGFGKSTVDSTKSLVTKILVPAAGLAREAVTPDWSRERPWLSLWSVWRHFSRSGTAWWNGAALPWLRSV